MQGGAGRCRKDRKVRRQKEEEEDGEHVGGNGEKEEEDKDSEYKDEKTTFSAWHSVNNADKWVMMKTEAVWIAAVLNSVTLK